MLQGLSPRQDWAGWRQPWSKKRRPLTPRHLATLCTIVIPSLLTIKITSECHRVDDNRSDLSNTLFLILSQLWEGACKRAERRDSSGLERSSLLPVLFERKSTEEVWEGYNRWIYYCETLDRVVSSFCLHATECSEPGEEKVSRIFFNFYWRLRNFIKYHRGKVKILRVIGVRKNQVPGDYSDFSKVWKCLFHELVVLETLIILFISKLILCSRISIKLLELILTLHTLNIYSLLICLRNMSSKFQILGRNLISIMDNYSSINYINVERFLIDQFLFSFF